MDHKSIKCDEFGLENKKKIQDKEDYMSHLSLEPPSEFQDQPSKITFKITVIEKFAASLMSTLISEALVIACKITWSIPCSPVCHMSSLPLPEIWKGMTLCWTPEHLQNSNQQNSKSSLSLRYSSSQISLMTSGLDESNGSLEALSSSHSSEIYNIPDNYDSDNYALPFHLTKEENHKPPVRRKKRHVPEMRFPPTYLMKDQTVSPKKRRKIPDHGSQWTPENNNGNKRIVNHMEPVCSKSKHAPTADDEIEFKRMSKTNSIESLGSERVKDKLKTVKNPFKSLCKSKFNTNKNNSDCKKKSGENKSINNLKRNNNNNNLRNKNFFYKKNNLTNKCKKTREYRESSSGSSSNLNRSSICRPNFARNIKQILCNFFRFKRLSETERCLEKLDTTHHNEDMSEKISQRDIQNLPSPMTKTPFYMRALPPLPQPEEKKQEDTRGFRPFRPGQLLQLPPVPQSSPEPELPVLPSKEIICNGGRVSNPDYASSIEKVKDCGWYWGPITGEAAEKLLENEPEGSFIVRDSSDDYYIFSLSFKLNNIIRHVRIEHDQGKFSFGSAHKFKRSTIVEFIESAVEHSRSGRYLFFLHRRPILGPMRIQLLHPVSRFKQIQSLQHMCRFVILRYIRRDIINKLGLPKDILEYLNVQHYYSEHFIYKEQSESEDTESDDDESLSSCAEEVKRYIPFRKLT